MEVCLANKWCWRTDANNDLCWQLGRIVWDIALSNKSCARYLSGCLCQALFSGFLPTTYNSPLKQWNYCSQHCCSVTKSCPTLWPHGLQHARASLSFQGLLKLMSIESVMPSNHVILCCPLLLLPSIFPIIRVSSSESVLCIRWPKDWSFSISPSSEYSGLISFRMDWLDLLVVQGTFTYLL